MKVTPNILLIQADQLRAASLPCYDHPLVQAPNLDALAEDGVVFDNAYCNNPICAPSRFSMLSGRYSSKIQAFDNASEFSSDIPTIAHYLRASGYQTCLAGKMHFVGADQLHGYEQRLTTDVYPSDFGWTPDWRKPEDRIDWWYHNMDSVVEAGPYERTNQIDFDDEVAFQAVRKIYDLARSGDDRPFFLTVSFTNPHDPYACPQKHWDLYNHDDVDLPATGYIPDDDLDPHSRRLRRIYLQRRDSITDEQIRNARHAYYGQISYVDEKIGEIRKALSNSGFDKNTIIIFTSDHGDMLGEKGLWYKMSFFEESVRVPLIFNFPESFRPGRAAAPLSLVDLAPTILDITNNQHLPEHSDDFDGQSLKSLLQGNAEVLERIVISEYFAEGSIAPCFMLRKGRYKYIYSKPDPPQLFDLEADPRELVNLASQPDYREMCLIFQDRLFTHQDEASLGREIVRNQRQRRLIFKAHMQGGRTSWDYQPYTDACLQYMRNHLDLNEVERRAKIRSRKKL